MSILSLTGVGKAYRNRAEEIVVFRDVDLVTEAGTTVVITGESGSGKSTLLNLIGGLDLPTWGTVVACEYDVGALSEADLTDYRSREVGFVFQFHYLLRDFSAIENVMLPAYMTGIAKRTALARAAKLLDGVGLSDRTTHYPSQLSGGERQRVAVARALINDPSLVLADEPTGNLDEGNSRIVQELLFSLVRDHGKTLLVVTHDRAQAARADVHLHLQHGELGGA
jgi:lipoprotein-releasing system ATP-binding protein